MKSHVDEQWKLYKNTGDEQAKEQLIIAYIDLVKIIAGRLYSAYQSNVEYDDLVSYCIIGLIDAIEKFDITKDVKFDTYANIRIRGAVIDQMRAMDWIPRSTRQKFRQLESAMNELRPEYSDDIPDHLLAEKMDMSIDELHKFLGESSMLSIMSLDEKISESPHFYIESSDRETSPEDHFADNEMKEILKTQIDHLPERQRTIIELYYFSELTYKEIAKVLDISESRISQLHSKSIMSMRVALSEIY